MTSGKKPSNAYSTGGGGFHFEAHVQAAFVTLMLTRGRALGLPPWPIVEIKLQGNIDGFETDDLIVIVENPVDKQQRKLLVQIKHSIAITSGSISFGEVIKDAWSDFKNPKLFAKNEDKIALITGTLSATDEHNVKWLLNQAMCTKDVNEFIRKVNQANFSPPKSSKKLQAIQHHLKAANDGNDVSEGELYEFLNHFLLISCDLGSEVGIVLSLLHSHISQFQQQYPKLVWSRVVDVVRTWNQNAGTITLDTLPEDILEVFEQKAVTLIPKNLKAPLQQSPINWGQHTDAHYLALTVLIGAWNERNQNDIQVITQLLGIDYNAWQQKAFKLLHSTDSPLSHRDGVWKVVNKAELWNQLGSYIPDQKLDLFKSIAVAVLKEYDPAFELPTDERYAAVIHGKVMQHSRELREGIAEGLAILGSQPDACSNCSKGKAETTSVLSVREILTDINWVAWGSLNDLLPDLAEASPVEFLKAVEYALSLTPCPFDRLFAEENNGITGRNYLTGLLWALEGLAWDEQYLILACVVLGELASHDPGGKWLNRPANSLTTILMPWLPQTLAPINKRKAAMQALLRESPDVGLNLIIQLLPGQHQSSLGSSKPKWRNPIPDDWKESVTHEEYWQQVSYYAELAIDVAVHNVAQLSRLINHFSNLPKDAFDQLIKTLNSQTFSELTEDQRLLLWEHLTQFTHRHRRYSDAKWALSDESLTRIEQIADKLAPANPSNRYRYLFTDNDFELYDGNDNWEEQRVKLNTRREKAVTEIFQRNGIDGVIQFAKSVVSPRLVGYALGSITDRVIERTLLPDFLNATDNKHGNLVAGFIWRRFQISGWEWCDSIDKSNWTPEQIRFFLTCLPFIKETWTRASKWLGKDQGTYWSRVYANPYHQADEDLTVAIEKLLEYNRPLAALDCLYKMGTGKKQTINIDLCVRALLAAPSSSEPVNSMDSYQIVELIKFLQSNPSITKENLFQIEWAYLPLLDDHDRGASPKLLEAGLANDPEFFCKVIQLIYRPKNVSQPLEKPSKESKTKAVNAWRLLYEWKTPPGLRDDGTFSPEQFDTWLQRVKLICAESGHLEVALDHIGKVLIHAPADPDGLWIHRSIAKALNDRDLTIEHMRDGFRVGIYNSRGVYVADSTGESEKELANQFYRKAEDVDNDGFQRFASTLRKLARIYEQEADGG